MHGLRATAIQRFAIVPASGAPVICQRETSRKRKQYRAGRFDAYMFGMRPPIATKDFVDQAMAGLRELGVAGESVGVDALNLEAADALGSLADQAGIPLVQMAVAFVIRHRAVTSAIIGPRTMEQLESQLPASELKLDDSILDRIDEIVPPGSNLDSNEVGLDNPALAPAARRR